VSSSGAADARGERTTSNFGFRYYQGGPYDQGLYAMTYRSIELVATAEGLRGTCTGEIEYVFGDVAFHPGFMGTLVGRPAGSGDVCTCESPSTREGLSCACSGVSCTRKLCPGDVQRSLECGNGVWVDQLTRGVTCPPPGGPRP